MSIIRWGDLREEEFNDVINKTDGICIVPVGCYEKHGQHLPVRTDVYEAVAISEKAAELEPACVFPAFEFGDVTALVNWKGSVILEPKLMVDLLGNYCKEIARNGFKKIVLVNFHGGNNPFLNLFLRTVQYEKTDYYVSSISPWMVKETTFKNIYENLKEKGTGFYPELLPEDEEVIRAFIEEGKTDGHGGLMETCLMLAIKPELVRLDRMSVDSGLSTGKSNKLAATGLSFPGSWGMNYPNSYQGHDPVGASERIGRLLLRLNGEVVAKACKVFKEDFALIEERREKVWEKK